MRATYCSRECHQHAWENYHAISCSPFFYIEGQKRDVPSMDDQQLEGLFRKMIQEKRPVHEIEDIFSRMSPEARERNIELLPCHEEEDPISGEPLSEMQPDNKMYLMVGAVKYCVSIDEMYK